MLAVLLAMAGGKPGTARASFVMLDPSFANGGSMSLAVAPGTQSDEAFGVAVQRDGKIVVAGYATDSPKKFTIARLTADGTLDASFLGGIRKLAIGTRSEARAVALDGDQRIVVAGFTVDGGTERFALARLLPDGRLDASFGTDTALPGTIKTPFTTRDARALALAIQPDGKIVVAGWVRNAANKDLAVARYTPAGILDPNFGSQGKVTLAIGTTNEEAAAIAVQPDGKLLLAGHLVDGGRKEMLVVRLTSAGGLDPSFDGTGAVRLTFGTGDQSAQAIALKPDGRILVAGDAKIGAGPQFAVAALDASGALDAFFGQEGRVTTAIGDLAEGRAIALHPRGRFVVAGRARSGGKIDFAVAQYRADGSLDPTFGERGILHFPIGNKADEAWATAIQPDGNVVLAGTTHTGGDASFGIARLVVGTCGDGFVDPGEECDGDDLGGDTCCSLGCTVEPAETVCRAAAGGCDLDERCNGSDTACPADDLAPAGLVCRAAAGDCDVAETCEGSSPECAPDARVPAGSVCRPGTDACDASELCDGIAADCPADELSPAGTTCRPGTDGCDASEVCDGASAACPEDRLSPAGTVCRAPVGTCDVAETCNGTAAACPNDQVLTAGTICRATGDACDLREVCDGVGGECPQDARKPDSDQDGICDERDVCPLVADPAQHDTDGDEIGDACDPCTGPSPIIRGFLRMTDFTTPGGDDTFRLRGKLVLPAAAVLAPRVHGARIVVEDGSGAVLFDVPVPPGAFDSEQGVGWKSNASRTRHVFRSRAPLGGLVSKLRLVLGERPGVVNFVLRGREGDYARLPMTLPLKATVVVGGMAAPSLGRCGEVKFPRVPGGACVLDSEERKLTCQ